MPGFWGYYLCPNCALFRCLCESSGLIYSISRISEYLRLIKPECNATGAFPGRLYLFLSNPRLGIKWIQIFYHCVGRCWGVVIVFLYFLDVQVWVALLLAKAQWTKSYQTYISNPLVTSKTEEEYSKIIRVVTTPMAIHITFNSRKNVETKIKTNNNNNNNNNNNRIRETKHQTHQHGYLPKTASPQNGRHPLYNTDPQGSGHPEQYGLGVSLACPMRVVLLIKLRNQGPHVKAAVVKIPIVRVYYAQIICNLKRSPNERKKSCVRPETLFRF